MWSLYMPFYLWIAISALIVLFLSFEFILNYIKKTYSRILFNLRIKMIQIIYYIKSNSIYRRIIYTIRLKTVQLTFIIRSIDYIRLINRLKKSPSFFCLVLIPLAISITFYTSSAHPILYVMTLSIYFAFIAIMFKLLNKNIVRIISFIIICIIFYSRFQPISKFPNTKDLGGGVIKVNAGEYIEQDFLLPGSDWRLNRLLNRTDIEAVLRTEGYFDLEDTYLYVNDKYIGELSSLLADNYFKPLPDSVKSIHKYLFKFPKDMLKNTNKITIRFTSQKEFEITYSSGIHPLPLSPHCRLIRADGSVEDVSERFYNRRCRYANVIYLYSNKYYPKKQFHPNYPKSPLILGSIL